MLSLTVEPTNKCRRQSQKITITTQYQILPSKNQLLKSLMRNKTFKNITCIKLKTPIKGQKSTK